MISSGSTTKGIGGGMCQFTNLIEDKKDKQSIREVSYELSINTN